jgi:hypothetical protein
LCIVAQLVLVRTSILESPRYVGILLGWIEMRC